MTHTYRPDEADSPQVYARRIAYLSCASTIRARTLDMFGRAPSLELCEEYRQAYLAQKGHTKALAEARSGGPAARHQNIPQAMVDRNAAMAAAYVSGKTFAQIAREFTLSPDHVRRVVSRAGVLRDAETHGKRSRHAVTQRMIGA